MKNKKISLGRVVIALFKEKKRKEKNDFKTNSFPSFSATPLQYTLFSKATPKKAKKWIKEKTNPTLLAFAIDSSISLGQPVTLMGFKEMIFQCSFCRGLAALFDFIIQSLAGQAIKQVPLGPPVHNNSLQVPTSNMSHQNLESDTHEWSCDEGGQSARANFTDKNGNDLCLEGEKAREDVAATPTIGTQPTGPPKKTVSFNDRAEVIYPSKDNKKKKETKKLTSMDREMDEEPKPGKSILRKGSNLNGEQGKL